MESDLAVLEDFLDGSVRSMYPCIGRFPKWSEENLSEQVFVLEHGISTIIFGGYAFHRGLNSSDRISKLLVPGGLSCLK